MWNLITEKNELVCLHAVIGGLNGCYWLRRVLCFSAKCWKNFYILGVQLLTFQWVCNRWLSLMTLMERKLTVEKDHTAKTTWSLSFLCVSPMGLFNNKESCEEITMLEPSHPTRIMNLWGKNGIQKPLMNKSTKDLLLCFPHKTMSCCIYTHI